jgi:hypothetical protein
MNSNFYLDKATKGPLRLSENRRYFKDSLGKAVFLTGSHHWGNLQDWSDLPVIDYSRYLNFLKERNHNLIRLWAWEYGCAGSTGYADPLPYPRTGPGTAHDGGLRFDASGNNWNEAYFELLLSRVKEACDNGIYVAVMLFEGWSIHREAFDDHCFNGCNNINGINEANSSVHTQYASEAALNSQKAYIRKVVETIDHLDNVLYEISNEEDVTSLEWQQDMVSFLKKLTEKPVGITYCGVTVDADLPNTNADWISPQTRLDPPAADGKKVILSDTDHSDPMTKGVVWKDMQHWIWKAFTRGHNILLMDGELEEVGTEDLPKARWACGDALSYADRMNLTGMIPQDGGTYPASTGYCLHQTGSEYLIFQPVVGTSFDLNLAEGSYSVEWWSVDNRYTKADSDIIDWSEGDISFSAPFCGPAVLYVKRR